MAYVKAWTSKEEVMNDLARASGKSTRKRDNLDEGYLVIGDAPPPVIPEDTDAEMDLLFGGALRGNTMPAEENNTPDLAGIQQMIRMMQDFNSGDDDNKNDAGDADLIAISKVSKLNPNVPEFTPRSRPIQNSRNNFRSPRKSKISRDINSSVVTQTDDVLKEESKIETKEVKGRESGDDNNLNLEKNIDGNKYEDIAMTLKNQISDAAKSDSYEYKKRKNVAIATLLKLYSKTNAEPKKNESKIKLITPEYFEGKMESPADVNVEDVFDVGSTATSSTPEPKDSSTTLPSCSTFSTSSNSTPSKKSRKVDPETKRSIEKVNRWLGEPTKPNSAAICLGPIEFKKKGHANCKSPVSDSTPKVTVVNSCQKYQPSKYAADLGKKYLERNKAIEKADNEVTWTNLERILKQKDLELSKKRVDEQAASTSS